jgi:hypothetical protein
MSRNGIFLVAAFLCSFTRFGSAAPPPNTDLENKLWFESLTQPGGLHLPCCSIADCHLTTSRSSSAGYEALIEGAWRTVPADRVLQKISNPTGRAVVCYRRVVEPLIERSEIMIFCFVRPPET